MEVVSIILGIIIAGAIGFFAGRNFSSEAKDKARLEQEVQEKQAELDAFRNKVTSHFEKTADLFNQVSDSYQSLYDHIAKSSNQLCAAPSFQSLPKKEQEKLEPSKTTINREKKDDSLFDANKLYNAHDYRNHEEANEEETTEKLEDDKVVQFETAKEDKSQPALDYAIKEKGVVNHNSLDIDGVKSS